MAQVEDGGWRAALQVVVDKALAEYLVLNTMMQHPKDIDALLVCTLYYRPPELLRANVFLGKVRSLTYTSAVDNWSAGCILREMIIGLGPEFRPARTIYSSTTSSIEQLDAIIKKFYLSSGFMNEKLATSFCNSTLKLPELTTLPLLMSQMLEVTRLLLIPNPEFRCTAGAALKTLEELEST
ncbi:cyclin-dependent kinase e-1 [Colletotrichum incanum]|nr:cyclin-dependent kinase e-1 [Colletotrichum incanum]